MIDANGQSGLPKVSMRLVGEDGNAFAILGRFQRAARRAGWSKEAIDAVFAQATSGNYEHLLVTIAEHVEEPEGSEVAS